MNIEQQIKQQIAETLRVKIDQLGDDVSLLDLNADSIDIFEMICDFEDKYKFEIPGADASKFIIVGDAVRELKRLIESR
jgi:acyl carrier protein